MMYIYREGTAYCINDIVRARRYLLGFSRQELSDGICAEKTIEKTEQHRSNLQYNNMKSIYSRLNLPRAYQYSSLITCNIADLEKEEEMWNLIGYGEIIKALEILSELKRKVPNFQYNQQLLGRAEIIIMKSLGKISYEEALSSMIGLLELTVPLENIKKFKKNKNHGHMKKDAVNRRIYFTSAEIYCLISIGDYYSILRDYENAALYMGILYEYFVANSEQNILYGSEGVFRVLIVKYSSLLGNIGQYELSNILADMSARLQLQLYRPQKIWWHKYNNIWNDNLRENDKEKYNSVLNECAILCQIYDSEQTAKIFSEKF